MKKMLATILATLLTITAFSQGKIAIKKINELCKKGNYRAYHVPGRGELLYIRCNSNNFFILKENSQSESGYLLNGKYEITKSRLRVVSVGSNFFLARTSNGTQYKYDFVLDSWSKGRAKDPKWRTSDRE